MDVEIIISGICTFVNLDNEDTRIIGPSVIILRADEHHHAENPEHAHDHPPADQPAKDCDCIHIPFIAFDTRDVAIDDSAGFREVEDAPLYKYLRLDGVELKISGDDVGVPVIDPTYGNVVSREMYWPEAAGQWNHDVVPRLGYRPLSRVVAAFMRFGGGKIAGGRLCPFKWKFTKLNGDTFSRHFAEEVVYSFEEPERDEVMITLCALEDGRVERRTLTFRRLHGKERLTLFLGNNTEKGMHASVRRRRSNNEPGEGAHFKLFDRVVDVGDAPTPRAPEGVEPLEPADDGGSGGASGGICGPKNG